MHKFRQILLWFTLVIIALFTGLSIYGAFLGSQRARVFFNTIPVAVCWIMLGLALILGCVFFPRLRRRPALLLIHAGGLLVLIGGLWGSMAGVTLQNRLFDGNQIPAGRLAIVEGAQENRVWLEDSNNMADLDFSVALEGFRMEYYEPYLLQVQSTQGHLWKFPVESGAIYDLTDYGGTLTILRTFENFKMRLSDQGNEAYDDPNAGANAAVEVSIQYPDGQVATQYIFERLPWPHAAHDRLHLRYLRTVREYTSTVTILKDGKAVLHRNIEVNHPLHYAGYHLYQSSYGWDRSSGRYYTVLQVVSDSGWMSVYTGYGMLCIGVFIRLWRRPGGNP